MNARIPLAVVEQNLYEVRRKIQLLTAYVWGLSNAR